MRISFLSSHFIISGRRARSCLVPEGQGHPAGDGQVLPDPGRLPGLLRRPQGHRQARHRHPGRKVLVAYCGRNAKGEQGAERDSKGSKM